MMQLAAQITVPQFSEDGHNGQSNATTGVLTVSSDRASVMVPEPDLNNVNRFNLDQVWTGETCAGPLLAYHGTPLIDAVIQGGTAVVCTIGENHEAKQSLVEDLDAGLIPTTAERLFQTLDDREQEGVESFMGTRASKQWKNIVRVSWYEIREDRLVDLLSLAGEEGPGRNLQFRDDPQLGLVVPGLWEVEVSSAEDVRQVLHSVRAKIEPLTQDGAHSLFVYNIQQLPVGAPSSKKSKGSKSTHESSSSNLTSAPRVSQFVLLQMGSASAVDPAAPNGVQGWVMALQDVLQSLENRHSRINWSQNKLTYLLRDILCNRMPSLLIASISGAIEDVASSGATLKFSSRLLDISNRLASKDSFVVNNEIRDVENFRSATGVQDDQEKQYGSSRTGSLGERVLTAVKSPKNAYLPSQQLHSHQDGVRANSPVRRGKPAALTLAQLNSAPTPRQSPEPSTSRASYGARAFSNFSDTSNGPAQHAASPRRSRSTSPQPSSAARVMFEQGKMNGVAPSVQEAEAIASQMYELAAQGDSSAKWFTAMLSALEASRAEVDSLQQHQEKLIETLQQTEHERDEARSQVHELQSQIRNAELPKNVKEQIKSLKQKLKESSQEVRDYELYRDVMESTMTKLKSEVAKLVEDRDHARKAARAAQSSVRREKDEIAHLRGEISRLTSQVASTKGQLSEAHASRRHLENLLSSSFQHHNMEMSAAHQQAEYEQEELKDSLEKAQRRLVHFANSEHDDTTHEPNGNYEQRDMDDDSLLNAVRGTAADVLHAVHSSRAAATQSEQSEELTMQSQQEVLAQGLREDMANVKYDIKRSNVPSRSTNGSTHKQSVYDRLSKTTTKSRRAALEAKNRSNR